MLNRKPRLLIVSPQVYAEPHSGTGMRAHFQAVHLSDIFEITVLSDTGLYTVDDGKFSEVARVPISESSRFHAFSQSVMRGTHYSYEKFRCRHWAKSDFKNFDAIIVHYPGMLSLLPADLPAKIPVLLDTHNNDREYFESVAEQSTNPIVRMAMLRQARISETLVRRNDARIVGTISVSEDDRKWVKSLMSNSTEHIVVPNNLFQFEATTWSGEKQILYIGSLDVSMNLQALDWFIDNVWVTLSPERPDIELVVAGRNPSSELTARLSDQGASVVADPKSLSDLFSAAKISIVPAISGSGGKIKVCESLSHGVPVLTTPQGVVGQPESIIRCCTVSDNPQTWILKMKEIFNEPHRASDSWISQAKSALDATYFGNTVTAIGELVLARLDNAKGIVP